MSVTINCLTGEIIITEEDNIPPPETQELSGQLNV